jgi:adenine-specific DNA-methyltransferase
VPVYIQEQISPKALIEDLRATSASRREAQLDLFSDFNGLPFEERVEFYQHPMHWTNRMIGGDSLTVMTSLAEKEGLKGQVQMIYVDPPYGIKFGSNWQVSTRKRDVKDGKVEDATRQPEQIRAFRDTWELGIHSYLAYLRDRFTVARDLLAESGSIFVQIGDENEHLVRSVMDEVLGSSNFVGLVTFRKTSSATALALAGVSDYILWFAKDLAALKFRRPWISAPAEDRTGYRWLRFGDGSYRGMTAREASGAEPLPAGARVYKPDNLTSQRPPGDFPVQFEGKSYRPARSYWKTSPDGMSRLIAAGRIHAASNSIQYVRYADDFPYVGVTNIWMDTGTGNFTEDKTYVVQTGTKVIERCMLMATDPGDLVLDPTCGSGTTAYVAEQWGRRWITVDTSRVALALARTRLMSARYPYYLMADTPEGQRKEADLSGQAAFGGTQGDIRKGFVYERVPHVTLKSIAQNPDIREGMTREEIDKAIARHAETELLYDRPYEDKKVVRVAGPFTVESLSPHRVVADGPEDHALGPDVPVEESGRFVTMILDNLRRAGVQNTVKGERLEFTTLDPFPGRWLHAKGEYLENEQPRRVAVAIGPEFGTVGPELVREAAKEAVGYFDLLVICGFAFDAMTEEERVKTSKLGSLTILQARMNPDLLMGDALKKTGAGNLFTVFGQPDIDVRSTADGRLQVEIRGVDIFDPNTGQIRSSGPDDIACWFIDTDYDGEAFFVRHAHFLGGDQPYDKLARALKAEVDLDAWESIYSAVSRPFPKPRSGRIAIKVINHFGDEVLKVAVV